MKMLMISKTLRFLKTRGRKDLSGIKTVAPFILIIFILSTMLSSCATVPLQIYVKKSQLSKFNAVVLNVSSSELDVKYSRETGQSRTSALFIFLGLAPFIIASGAEAGIESSQDRYHAEGVREAMGKYYFEKLLKDYFLGHLKKASLFKINYSDQKSHKVLKREGYDACIELKIEELSLKRAMRTDMLNVYASVWGKMVDLQKGEVIWRRHEFIMSDEKHTLEKYKAEGGEALKNLIDKLFRKIALRLASDIVYSN